MSNKQENFDVQLDKNITLEQLFNCSKASHIKRVLIIISKDLEKAINWRENQRISILVKESLRLVTKRNIFKIQEDNKLRVNLKHLVYYTLLQIAYIDNYYNIYKALKKKNHKYPVRIYQILSELKYRNTKFIYRWHLIKEQ